MILVVDSAGKEACADPEEKMASTLCCADVNQFELASEVAVHSCSDARVLPGADIELLATASSLTHDAYDPPSKWPFKVPAVGATSVPRPSHTKASLVAPAGQRSTNALDRSPFTSVNGPYILIN